MVWLLHKFCIVSKTYLGTDRFKKYIINDIFYEVIVIVMYSTMW